MKALSILQPWAEEIRLGKKQIEYRSWKTNYRGEVLICASKNNVQIRGTDDEDKSLPLGMAVAIATIVGCVWQPQLKLYGFHLENVRTIEPFPVRGNLRLFEVETPAHFLPEIAGESEG